MGFGPVFLISTSNSRAQFLFPFFLNVCSFLSFTLDGDVRRHFVAKLPLVRGGLVRAVLPGLGRARPQPEGDDEQGEGDNQERGEVPGLN